MKVLFSNALGSISSAGQSITDTSCPFSSRTAAKYAKPIGKIKLMSINSL